MANYNDLIPNSKKSPSKLVNYKDFLGGKTNKYSDLVPKTKPKSEPSVLSKIISGGKQFILPDRGFDLTPKTTLTTKVGQKVVIPDVTGQNWAKVSTKEKLSGAARYGAEILALPEAIGNLILSGVSKATKIGEVKDSALQKRLLEFAQPKTKGEAETMRLLDVISLLTPPGAATKPAKVAADATRAKVITRKVPVASEATTSKVPVGTPTTRQGDYAKSMGYEPIRPDSELPVIEMGTKPETTTGLPIIQRDVPTKPITPPGFKYEPIKEIIEQGRQAPTLVDEAAATVQPSRPQAPDLSVPPVSGRTLPEDIGDTVPDYFKREEALRRNEPTLPVSEIDVNKIIDEGYPSLSKEKRDLIKDQLNDTKRDTVTVYRAGNTASLRGGDFVALDRGHAEKYLTRGEGRNIVEQEIPKSALEYNSRAGDFMYKPTTGETITPKLSSDIEADAIAKGVVSKYENLPEVPKMNMQESISNASKLAVDDFERAKRIALGDESVPQGTEIGMVYEAVKQKAVKDNNWELLRELATNPNAAPTQATRAGQVVKSFDTMSDSIDPVELMQSVTKSREKGANILKKAEKGATVKSAKEAVSKAKPKKDAWVDFINNIEC